MYEKEREKYLKNPNICPFCESNDLDCGRMEADSEIARQNVICNNCLAEWTDEYSLRGVTFLGET